MEYRKLGKSDLQVSAVALGTWAIGGDFWGPMDDQQSIKTIQHAIDCGITLIDTAPAYGGGHSEELVGQAIKGRRQDVILATKCGIVKDGDNTQKNLRPESIRREIEQSLTRLKTDVIDLYQIHWPDSSTPLEDSLEELVRLREAGKYRYLGVSNFSVELMKKTMGITEMVSLQPEFSLLEREIEPEKLPFCRQHNIGLLAYGPLGGGVLTGKYKKPPTFGPGDNRGKFYPYFQEPYWSKVMDLVDLLQEIGKQRNKPVAQVAINWVIQQPGITAALVGAKTPTQAQANAEAANWKLSNEELEQIKQTYATIFKV